MTTVDLYWSFRSPYSSHLIFGGTRGWDQGEHLERAAQRAGLDLAEMDRAIEDSASHAQEVSANQDALASAGHWGVPTFVYEGEPFFGEDRIDTLAWRLARDGVPRRR
jgi:2-hydroxychromene-2-carboxylate isomerase